MNGKLFIFTFLLALLLIGSASFETFAYEEDYSFCDDWEEIEIVASETGSATGSALIANALYLQNQELHAINKELLSVSTELQSIVAFLLLLVGFELMRIVRGWRKGFGVK